LQFHLDTVGRTRDTEEFRVNSHRLAQFARALDDENPAHLEGRLAPPVFAHVPVMQSLVEIIGLAADAAPLHGEHDFHFLRPIVPGQRLFSLSILQAIRQSKAGVLLIVRSESKDVNGAGVCVQHSTCLVPGGSIDADRGEPAPTRPQASAGRQIARMECGLTDDVSRRYADAARDYSPYTMLPEAARKMGFSAPILHGMCTLGYASRAVVEQGCGGDSRRLKRLGGRFTHPVFMVPGQRLATTLFETGAGEGGRRLLRFETTDRDGNTVIRNGFAEVSE
jgi:acyl dehydratase